MGSGSGRELSPGFCSFAENAQYRLVHENIAHNPVDVHIRSAGETPEDKHGFFDAVFGMESSFGTPQEHRSTNSHSKTF